MPTDQSQAITIRMDEDVVSINGKEFRGPPSYDDLHQLFGKETFKTDMPEGHTDNYWFWADLGVYAFGHSYSRVSIISVIIDDNGNVPHTIHRHPGLRAYTGSLTVCGLRRYDSDSAEVYAERLKAEKFPVHQGNTWTAPAGSIPYKHLLLSAGVEDSNQLYYAEIRFRFRDVESQEPSNTPKDKAIRDTSTTVTTAAEPAKSERYPATATDFPQPISIREDGSYSGGFRRETGAIFARWFWRVGWILCVFFIAFICILLYLSLR